MNAPRCAGGNGRPVHRPVWMRYAGRESGQATHLCPVCSAKALNGMIQSASMLPVPVETRVVQRNVYVPEPVPTGVGAGTVIAVGILALLVGAAIASSRE